jgi:hypothetical protein
MKIKWKQAGRRFWVKWTWVPCFVILLGLFTGCSAVKGGGNKNPNSTAQLDAFMKQWATYEAFKAPMELKDEPLLLAALKKDPSGPWAAYISLKFAQTEFEARDLDANGRIACYHASLSYLKPAHGILAQATKANPQNKELQQKLSGIEEHLAQVSLETGLDLAEVKSDAEAALAANTNTQSWNYGNKIFKQHTKLGRVALRKGDIDEAKKQLLASGRTPGSPQLNSYGPDFTLARELAEKGEFDTVIQFLDLVACFWANPDITKPKYKRLAYDHLELLESWKKELRAGKIPDHRKWR